MSGRASRRSLTTRQKYRGVIYTTSAIESVNMNMRKKSMGRGLFPFDEALLKLFYQVLRNIGTK